MKELEELTGNECEAISGGATGQLIELSPWLGPGRIMPMYGGFFPPEPIIRPMYGIFLPWTSSE